MEYIPLEMCSSIDGPLTANVNGYTQIGLFHERTYPRCTCPAYKFAKRTINFGGVMMPPVCKHIIQAQKQVCGWHQQYSKEPLEKSGTCPRCGASTVFVKVAV